MQKTPTTSSSLSTITLSATEKTQLCK